MGTPYKTGASLPEVDLRTWASEHLELPPAAGPRETQVAFLKKLAEYGWLPPPAIEESHAYLASRTGAGMFPSLAEQALQDEEFRLLARVDDFSRTFFDSAPRERRKQHTDLVEQCAWCVNLSARLHGLEAGLGLARRNWEDVSAAERGLAEQVCQLFTLPPPERARRRWELLQEHEALDKREQASARSAAEELKQNYPELAALEPGLVAELADGPARKRSQPRLPSVLPSAGSQPAQSSNGSKWAIGLVIFAIVMVSRMALSNNNNPRPPVNPPLPFKQPEFKHQDFNEILRKMRERQQQNPAPIADPPKKLFDEMADPKGGGAKPDINQRVQEAGLINQAFRDYQEKVQQIKKANPGNSVRLEMKALQEFNDTVRKIQENRGKPPPPNVDDPPPKER